MATLAAIDLGSNALRLRIVEVQQPEVTVDGRPRSMVFREVHSLRVPVRLGAEVFLTGRLAKGSIGKASEALREFRRALDSAGVSLYRAVATSAVRDAEDGHLLVERVRREAGIELEIIEGIEEARLIQLGVRKRLPLRGKRVLSFDVGGGSTEFSLIEDGEVTLSVSLPLGSVRLLETFLDGGAARGGVVDRAQLRLLDEQIERTLAELPPELTKQPIDHLIGTGGNVETLAELCPAAAGLGLGDEPRLELKSPRAIDVPAMKSLVQKMSAMTSAQRRAQYSLRADRADTIVPASRIFTCVAERCGRDRIVAPGVGLREGLLLELAEKAFDLWDDAAESRSVLAACLRLGQRYRFDEAHGRIVERFAGQLFDATAKLHGYGPRERLVLSASALLHDIGDFVRYDGHHKHSYYLIANADIMGLSAAERMVVANVARYHRKGGPEVSHSNYQTLTKDDRARVRVLASLLRIADALDREHLGKIESIEVTLDAPSRKLRLALFGERDRALEEWSVREKAALLREVFGLEVELAAPHEIEEPAA